MKILRKLIFGFTACGLFSTAQEAIAADFSADTYGAFFGAPAVGPLTNLGVSAIPGGGNAFGSITYNLAADGILTITLDNTGVGAGPGNFDGFVFSLHGPVQSFGATELSSSGVATAPGYNPADVGAISSGPDGFKVNLAGAVSTTSDAYIQVQVNPLVAKAPEPAAWALMLVGFGILGGAVRARRGELAVN
jgi:hypothetical protein